jgi:hypothetical protein
MSTILDSALLAHSWGWDEVLLFVVPIVLALGVIRVVERRAAQRAGGAEDEEPTRHDAEAEQRPSD